MSIEGTKPRKWNKTININNPTMQQNKFQKRHSHNILSIFDPEVSKVHDSPIKYYANKNYRQSLPKRAWQSLKKDTKADALDQSLRKFSTIQHQRIQQKTPIGKYHDREQLSLNDRRQKVWLSRQVMQNEIKKSYAYNPELYMNYQNSKSIKNKQLHGYNIISNF